MTNEEKVKAKWPDAHIKGVSRRESEFSPMWYAIYAGGNMVSGWKFNQMQAWEDAAKRIGGAEQ